MKKVFLFLITMLALGASAVELTVAPQERKEIELPAVQPGNTLKLRIQARVDSPKLGGMLDAMILFMGNQRITEKELINRKNEITYRNKRHPLYRNSRWMILYAPDFQSDTTAAHFTGENLFTYEFDLSGLIKPGTKTVLTVVNPWSAETAKRWKSELKLVINIDFTEIKETVKEVVKNENEIFIAPEKEYQMNIEHNPSERTLLKLKMRRECKRFGGWNYITKLTINDQPIRAQLDRETLILVNRPESFLRKTTNKTIYYDKGDGSWLTLFSNDYKPPPAHYTLPDPEPYVYLFDLTPLLKPGKNTFKARNLYTEGQARSYKTDLSVVMIPEIIREPLEASKSAKKTAKPELGTIQSATIAKDGAIEIIAGKQKIRFVSQFSQPGGGWNYLGSDNSKDENWKIKINKTSDKFSTVEASGKDYIVNRTIKLNDNRLKITDNFKNLGQEPVAIRFANELDFSSMRLPICRMGGQESHSLNNYGSPTNSTMYFPMEKSGLGVVLEDDISRNQSEFYYESKDKRSGFRDNFFYLEPKAEYKVEWSIYITPDSDDYYDFINQVRRDWGVNHTMEGPFYFTGEHDIFGKSEAALKRIVERKNVKYVCFWEVRTAPKRKIPGTGDKGGFFAYGSALFNPLIAPERESRIKAIAQWHKLFPQVKVSQYYHCFFQGFEQPDDLTFEDSFITAADGSRVASTYSHKEYYVFRTVYPKPGNSFWDIHIKSLDYLFDTMKVDWLYWDESSGPGSTAKDRVGSASVTFNATDGNSALIDQTTNTIIKKCAMLPLITIPAIQEGINRAKSKGGVVLFNGAPTCRYREQLGILSMAETQDVISRAYELHLSTPLAYGMGSPPFSAIVERLNYGTVYLREHLGYPSLALSKFFPLTIEEINRGWVKGKERVITNRSGEFGWNGKYSAKIWSFDANGKLADENPVSLDFNNKTKIEVLNGGLTVLERLK